MATNSTLIRDLQFLISNRKDFTVVGLDEKIDQIIYVRDNDGFLHKSRRGNLMRGIKLGSQSVLDKEGYYVHKFNKVHNFKYSYSDFIFNKKYGVYKVKILCPEHGYFWQDITDHITGHGCNKCANRLRKGYTKTQWIDFCNKTGRDLNIIYVTRCYNEEEEFIKIGLTSRTVNYRFHGQMMPYKYEIIKEFQYSPEEAYDEERKLHRKYKEFKYLPKLEFGGRKECFSMDIITDFIT